MDDVDAVQAQISRNMFVSGDWVTARLDGVAYLEKAPLVYWMIAVSYRLFGIHDWAARVPIAIGSIALCWITYRFAHWSFGEPSGLYAGIVLATSAGLFLFTRILIPDVLLTLSLTLSIWAWFRLSEQEENERALWSFILGLSLGLGLLLKGLIAIVFPVVSGMVYMVFTRKLFSLDSWRRMKPGVASITTLAIALPWHILAIKRNPPYFDLALYSRPGQYHGFFWFYFVNEQLLRFLNLRYPRDYNTVSRPLFWLLNLVWLFPWSAYLAARSPLSFSTKTRANRTLAMATCWIVVVMLFFTFSTTQEYYSMPVYPALALLIASALGAESPRIVACTRALVVSFGVLALTFLILFLSVLRLPHEGDIYKALTQNPSLYTLSLGHMRDLTVNAFAYLKMPLAIAALAFGAGAVALKLHSNSTRKAVFVVSATMILFFQATRIALVRFDSYLSSFKFAEILAHSPGGVLIEANSYYAFASVFFYTSRNALLLNGRNNNLEYGSYAPGAPAIFIDDKAFASLWLGTDRCYLLAYGTEIPHLEKIVGRSNISIVAQNSGNYLLTNYALP
jgi:hypothetical protein